MVAILDRCHDCGTQLVEADKFCSNCGVERPKPSEAALEGLDTQPPGGMAWSYRIPVVNNRITWIRWGWTIFWFSTCLTLPITVLLFATYGDPSASGFAFAGKLFLGLALFPAAMILGMGLFAVVLSGNGIASRTTLTPEGCTVSTKGERAVAAVETVALLLGNNSRSAGSTPGALALLLPGDGDAKFAEVRRVQIDPVRRVITLRRRWHNPLRLYVPEERFEDAVAYVQERVPNMTGRPARSAE